MTQTGLQMQNQVVQTEAVGLLYDQGYFSINYYIIC